MKVEGGDAAALDCSRNSRASEKHPLDSVLTALHNSSKRKQLGSDGQADSVPGEKRRRLISEVRALIPLVLGGALHSRASTLGSEERLSLKPSDIQLPFLGGRQSLHNTTMLRDVGGKGLLMSGRVHRWLPWLYLQGRCREAGAAGLFLDEVSHS